jgi:hypothetical protein
MSYSRCAAARHVLRKRTILTAAIYSERSHERTKASLQPQPQLLLNATSFGPQTTSRRRAHSPALLLSQVIFPLV